LPPVAFAQAVEKASSGSVTSRGRAERWRMHGDRAGAALERQQRLFQGPESLLRAATITATGCSTTRCATYSTNRIDRASADRASSTSSASGPRSARFATSQYRPVLLRNSGL
jgi:hypothetical protein